MSESSSNSSSELISRLVTAVIGIPILLYLILWGPAWGFAALVAAAAAVAAWEYCSITYGDEHRTGKILTSALAPGLVAVFFAAPDWALEAAVAAVVAVALCFLLTFRDISKVSHRLASSVTALLYGGVFLGLLVVLHAQPSGPLWIIMTLVVVWMSDTGAYFTGRALGRHSLYESVSPNKSIEGSVGGLLGSIAGAFFCNWLFVQIGDWNALSATMLLALAIPANVLAQLGDLAESLIKRAHDADDSGTILGGHGGLLDRIDGLMFAAPWFYLCVVRLLPLLQQ